MFKNITLATISTIIALIMLLGVTIVVDKIEKSLFDSCVENLFEPASTTKECNR